MSAPKAVPYSERWMTCASCQARAVWRITKPNGDPGPSSCERHRELWLRRLADR